MLRTNITAHFATQHSPEKEQRLVFAATPTSTGDENVDALGQNVDAFGAGVYSTENVDSTTSTINTRVMGTAAETLVLPRVEQKSELFDIVHKNGALDAHIDELAASRGLKDADAADSLAKEQMAEALLQKPENALLIARMLQEHETAYEEFVREIAVGLKQFENYGLFMDAAQLLNVVERLKARPETENEYLQEFADALEVPLEGHKDALGKIAVLANNIIKYNIRRDSFAKYEVGDSQEDVARTLAKDKKLESMRKQSNVVRQYLDVVLRRESDVAYGTAATWVRQFENKVDGQIFEEIGVTDSGLRDVFAEHAETFSSIARKNDVSPERNLPSPSERDYLDKANGALERLEKSRIAEQMVSWTLPSGRIVNGPAYVKERFIQEQANEDMVRDIATRTQSQLTKLGDADQSSETRKQLTDINEVVGTFAPGATPSAEDRMTARTMPSEVLRRYQRLLNALDGTPDLGKKIDMASPQQAAMSKEFSTQNKLKLLGRVEQLEAVLPELLLHPVCDATGIREAVREKIRAIQLALTTKDEFGEGVLKGGEMTAEEYGAACIDADELEKCRDLVRAVQNDPAKIETIATATEFAQRFPGEEKTKGIYNYADKRIYLNAAACADANELVATKEHEQGHAILDIVSRQTGVMPNLYGDLRLRLSAAAESQGDSLEALLRKVSKERWGYTGDEKEEELLDELVVQYADYQRGNLNGAPTGDEQKLFALFEAENQPGTTESTTEDGGPRIARAARGASSADDPTEKTENEKPNPRGMLQSLDMKIKRIESFFEVYPEQRKGAFIEQDLADIKRSYAEGKKAFDANDGEDYVKKLVNVGLEVADGYLKLIRKFDAAKMDLTYAEKTQKSTLYKTVIENANWLSISDVMTLFKDAGEDIKRMWKRRSESARSKFGKTLFGMIPESAPYIGQLQREFHGREKASEQEEVGVWEKRYEKIDSHVLLHDILPKLVRKDSVKGVVNLLTKRGRMDWNYEPFWNVLEKLSIYHMPHEACFRDQQLRNMYLQKLIANIWDDKDQFEHWKNENDSQIGSGKSHLQATIDELSATQGGLAGKLRYLLEKLKLQNMHIKGVPAKEEEINPHLYEGILHYAMRNGKMSMEDKIFFLIQGVANDMFSIDRMKGFVGEQGEILNSFPVIDFFNGKTYPEIMEMARKIGYPDADEPDYRTTDFLLDEIRVDDGARKRVQKGLKAVQNWDHEDLPMFVSMLDYKAINDVIAPTSGSTPKVTLEGMKNIYVGYNTALQYFAIRAKHALEHNAPFTDEDARQCMTILTAYFNYDNRVTIPAPASTRPTLSWTNINNEKPVSGGDYFTREYRNVLNQFSLDLAKTRNIKSSGSYPIETYIGLKRDATNKLKYEDLDKDTPSFSDSFTKEFSTGPGKQELIKLLAKMAVKVPRAGGFIPEGFDEKSSVNYNYKAVSKHFGGADEGAAHGGHGH